MPFKFCANLSYMFQETESLLERYEAAKNAGFKAIECGNIYDFPADTVARAKKESGLKQVMINAYPGNWNRGDRGLAALPLRQKEFEDSISTSVEYALKLRCKRIHVMAGVVLREVAQNLTTYTRNMVFAADFFKANGIIGLIEPINPNTIKHYFLNTCQKAMSVVENINSDYLKMQLDLFHLQQISGNLTKNIEKYLPFVGHIQISQVPGRNEPDSPGEIDFRYILSLLENLEYDGWIGLEYMPMNDTVDGLNWIRDFGYKL